MDDSGHEGPVVNDRPVQAVSLLTMLHASATRRAAAVAVVGAGRRLTYRDLLDEAHGLAEYLVKCGVRAGVPVASCLPRGVAAVVTQLAVLTIGAIYVPVDPAHPDPLLRQLLSGVRSRHLVVERERDAVGDAQQIVVGDPAIPRSSSGRTWPEPPLDALAIVIHTSGSTGRPKPVALSHRAIANSTQARLHRYHRGVGEFAMASPMTFDMSLVGIWWTFATGGTLRILAPDTAGMFSELADALSAGTLTHTMLTPSVYRQVLSTVHKPAPTLQQILVGGEPCPADLVEEHYRRMPEVELTNEYGPTEAAIWCAGATLRPGEDVVIGTPVLNTEVLVLEGDRQVVPAGEFGELCIGGPSLADGYLGLPGLTSTVFIPHPADPSRRIYRTGDRGRWRPDGRLEIRGRLDEQVKVRGHRVELGGVAAVLRAVPGVRDAVVSKRSDRLVAYVTSETADTADPETLYSELRRHADQLLPEYERPAAYVLLPGLPLAASGKIDHAALPEPVATRPELSSDYVPPALPSEHRIAAIFSGLLDVHPIGLHDNFIELGGDSLLAARAAHLIGDEFGVQAPIRTVFDQPTVARLTAWVATAPARARIAVTGSAEAAPAGRLPLTEIQASSWAYDQALRWNTVAGPDFTLSATYRINGALDVGALGEAVDELVSRHEALRTSLWLRPGEEYQLIGQPATGLLRVASPRAELADLLRAEPLEPASGRVFAADLISNSDVEHLLSVRVQHLIADDWSFRLIERELSELYADLLVGRAPGLGPAPSYYSAITQAATTISAADQLYWAGKCRGVRPVELIPPERLRRPDAVHQVRGTSVVVPAADFLELVRTNQVTLHTAVYAMTHALVAADTGAQDITLNTVNAARRNAELEQTVGLFVDTAIVRQRFSPGLTFRDSLRPAAEELDATYRHSNATMSVLLAEVPEMLAMMVDAQPIMFETVAPVTGLRLANCSIQRRDPFHADYDGQPYRLPAGLTVIVRPEGNALRLFAFYDTALLPAAYVDNLLQRMREIVLTCGQHGDRPLRSLIPADLSLRAP